MRINFTKGTKVMAGLGTIMNVSGIILGGLLGMVFGKFVGERIQNGIITATGLCVMFIGMGGALEKMLTVSQEGLKSGGSFMIIGCFTGGVLLGEWLDIEARMEQFGEWLKKKSKSEGDAGFVEGFVNASFTVCIGAMAVVGAIQDGIWGDYTLLGAKTILDLIIVLVMTSSMGKGCIFSAIPVGIFQGSITLLAGFLEPFLTDQALDQLSLTGSMLIFCVGVNLVWGKKFRVANMLPTIVLAVLWALVSPGL